MIQAPPLRLVRQEDAYGCTVASLAMIMGLTYQEAKALFHPWHYGPKWSGFMMMEAQRVLAEHGYATALRYRHHHGLCCELADWPPAPWADRHLCEIGSPYHSVVMRGDGRVLDPYRGEVDSLNFYGSVSQVAAVYRVHDGPIPGAITRPDDLGRCRPEVCGCAAAWPEAAA